jgi:glyoxylase-like metal-dependent hydrolase (beta-lactamase superfamily II)
MIGATLPGWCHFLRQDYPSANLVLLTGAHPVLIDSGYGSDSPIILRQLEAAGTPASALELLVNTHWHSDHVGGNHTFQHDHGVPIAAARSDAMAVNVRAPHACLAAWLDQPIEPYRVDRPLDPGDVLWAGEAEWQVIATPGHTPAHLSLFQAEERLLILGDALLQDDVGWINLVVDGPAALDQAMHTLEKLAGLPARCALSGHGPPITDLPAAVARALDRYEKMRRDPNRVAWHAMKRIFAFALMIHQGLPLAEVDAYLARCGWLTDHAAKVLKTTAASVAAKLLQEMRRSGAVVERDGRLWAATPYRPALANWRRQPGFPGEWP